MSHHIGLYKYKEIHDLPFVGDQQPIIHYIVSLEYGTDWLDG